MKKRGRGILNGFTLSFFLHLLLIATFAYGKPSPHRLLPEKEEVIKVSFITLSAPPQEAPVTSVHAPPKPNVFKKRALALKKKKQIKRKKRIARLKKKEKPEQKLQQKQKKLPLKHQNQLKRKTEVTAAQLRDTFSAKQFQQLKLGLITRLIQEKIRYPFIARKLRWKGRVVFRFLLLPDGSLQEIQLMQSSSHAVLDKAVLHALERISQVDNLPHPKEAIHITVPVRFSFK